MLFTLVGLGGLEPHETTGATVSMVRVMVAVALAGPTLLAWSRTEPDLRLITTVLPEVQPVKVIEKVMLFAVVMPGVAEHPVIAKSLAVRPETASLKTSV